MNEQEYNSLLEDVLELEKTLKTMKLDDELRKIRRIKDFVEQHDPARDVE